MTSYSQGILDKIKSTHKDIEVLKDCKDWVEYFKNNKAHETNK